MATPSNPANLSWSGDDRSLYFVAGPPSRRVPYRITVGPDGAPSAPQSLAPTNGQPGANYPVATIGRDNRLFAVRECCRLPNAEIIYEFGYIDLSATDRPFVPLLELTETGIDRPITLVSAGTLVPPAIGDPQTWTQTERDGEPAWLLSDGTMLTYLFQDDNGWSFADERLEHPGRSNFDGISVGTTGLIDALPDAPPTIELEVPSPSPSASSSPSSSPRANPSASARRPTPRASPV